MASSAISCLSDGCKVSITAAVANLNPLFVDGGAHLAKISLRNLRDQQSIQIGDVSFVENLPIHTKVVVPTLTAVVDMLNIEQSVCSFTVRGNTAEHLRHPPLSFSNAKMLLHGLETKRVTFESTLYQNGGGSGQMRAVHRQFPFWVSSWPPNAASGGANAVVVAP